MTKQDPPIQFRDKHLTVALGKRALDDERPGRTACRLLRRFFLVCHHAYPTLPLAEWCALFDALKDTWDEEAHHPYYVHSAVRQARGLGDRWDIDQEALAARLQAMDLAARCAVVDAVEQFWAGYWPAGQSYAAIVRAIVGESHIREDSHAAQQ